MKSGGIGNSSSWKSDAAPVVRSSQNDASLKAMPKETVLHSPPKLDQEVEQ